MMSRLQPAVLAVHAQQVAVGHDVGAADLVDAVRLRRDPRAVPPRPRGSGRRRRSRSAGRACAPTRRGHRRQLLDEVADHLERRRSAPDDDRRAELDRPARRSMPGCGRPRGGSRGARRACPHRHPARRRTRCAARPPRAPPRRRWWRPGGRARRSRRRRRACARGRTRYRSLRPPPAPRRVERVRRDDLGVLVAMPRRRLGERAAARTA